jgi:hypothetical protein
MTLEQLLYVCLKQGVTFYSDFPEIICFLKITFCDFLSKSMKNNFLWFPE